MASALRHATPPTCADCGYDRTGLPDTPDDPAPCPECGGKTIDVPWSGWSDVLLRSASPAWIACAVGIILPLFVTLSIRDPFYFASTQVLALLLIGTGAVVTCVLAFGVPVEIGGNHTRSLRSRPSRPGMLRVVAAGWLVTWGGIAAMMLLLSTHIR